MATYDPQKVIVVYEPVGSPVGVITGFADGDFIEVERVSEAFKTTVGADGEAARSASADLSATAKITLLQTSLSNDAMSAAIALDRLTKANTGPFTLKDAGGSTLVNFPNAWIVKEATIKRGKEIVGVEWTIGTGSAQTIIAGGNP